MGVLFTHPAAAQHAPDSRTRSFRIEIIPIYQLSGTTYRSPGCRMDAANINKRAYWDYWNQNRSSLIPLMV